MNDDDEPLKIWCRRCCAWRNDNGNGECEECLVEHHFMPYGKMTPKAKVPYVFSATELQMIADGVLDKYGHLIPFSSYPKRSHRDNPLSADEVHGFDWADDEDDGGHDD